MKFRELYIQNVGVFDSFKISFPERKDSTKAEIHIFTGVNGSGKSTILYALAGMFEYSELLFKRFRNENPESYVETKIDEMFVGVKKINNNKIEGNFSSINTETSLVHVFSHGNLTAYVSDKVFSPMHKINRPIEFLWNKLNYNPSLRNINFDFVAFSYSGYRSITNYTMDAMKEISVSPFADSLSFLKSVNIDTLIQWIANTKTKLALAKSDGNASKDVERYAKSLENIENIVKEITGIEVKFILLREPLAVAINYDGKDIALDLLPDGLKSIISWVADLLMRMDRIPWVDDRNIFDREFILFLDEIEVHLHPKWQRKILPVIQKYFKNAQIFIATHSPFVVGSVEGATIHKLDVIEGKSVLVSTEDSKAGNSIELILEDVFGVKEEFDDETIQELTEFKELRNQILNGKKENLEIFKSKVTKLKQKSYELKDIISLEISQLSKRTGESYDV